MKFGHVGGYNKRNIFPQEICRTWDRETSSNLFLERPFGNLDISIGIDVGIAKILFCLVKSLFPFKVSYEESIHGEVLFEYTSINAVDQMASL